MRHGEAQARNAEGDAARALTPRGIAECRRLAAHLKDEGAAWDVALCSNARRTHESAQLLAGAMDTPPPLEVREDLNLASTETLLAVIRSLPEEAHTVLLVAHNPGAHALVQLLSGIGGGQAARKATRDFPAGALARLTSDSAAWTHLAPGTAILRAFITPRELG